jgi:hypothetical protein
MIQAKVNVAYDTLAQENFCALSVCMTELRTKSVDHDLMANTGHEKIILIPQYVY